MKIQVKKSNISQQTVTFPEKNTILEALKTLIGPKEKTIVAISGGSDSMLTAVLVYNFFITNKYSLQNLFFVHFNHKIRPESNQEEKFVKTYFKGTNLICISLSSNKLSSLIREGDHKVVVGLKTEASLRNRRYSELQKLTKKYKANHIILGHNLSDRIESTFLNLLRGAGLKGFISMQSDEHHHLLPGINIIRPLLELSKPTITDICNKNHIPYVTDASNYESKTSLRNKLRNEILPQLYTLTKTQKGQETFEQSMLNVYNELEKLQGTNLQSVVICNFTPSSAGLQSINQSPFRKSIFAYQRNIPQKDHGPVRGITIENIIQILNQLGIYNNVSSAFLNELLKFLKTATNGYKYFNKTYFFIAHGKIYIIQAPENFWVKTPRGASPKKGYRYPKPGDRYKGKTRNQYCITQKIPLFRRNFIPILEKDGKIVKVIKSKIGN